jgi:NAD(P)-dependent dehydrogenase (short-subunit alcohol dehydrogenase family)
LQAERIFHLADLLSFAELSGDYNPLHTDPIAARRTQFGNCVAHGVLVLLWALETYQRQTGSRRKWSRVNARFLRPILADLKISATGENKSENQSSLVVMEGGRTMLQCELDWEMQGMPISQVPLNSKTPPREDPDLIQSKEAKSVEGTLELHWPRELGTRLFPTLASTQNPASIAALLASTRVIGMKVPGAHSIFLQADLSFGSFPDASDLFSFKVSEYRQSSQRLAIALQGKSSKGVLWALFRPPPVVQPDMATVKQRVPNSLFAGRRVIVIGGSRGLGEMAAKVLAAGGAEVALSYRTGRTDAERVATDIVNQGGKAKSFELDVESGGWETTLGTHCKSFDHLCYFATPPIVGGDGTGFDQSIFEKFCSVYVKGLVSLSQWLAKSNAGQFGVFNPSSVYVEVPPLRNLEYACAKGASEACCNWLKTAYPKARVHVARFPRLATDQTASFLAAGEHDTLEAVLKELLAWTAH